jgi:hypothetical protein
MLLKQPQTSNAYDQNPLARQNPIHDRLHPSPVSIKKTKKSAARSMPHRNLFEVPHPQNQPSLMYSLPQLKAAKLLTRVFKESKIHITSKKPTKVASKVKHQLMSKHPKKESKESKMVIEDTVDMPKRLVQSSPLSSNSSLQMVTHGEQQLYAVRVTTGPVVSSQMSAGSGMLMTAQNVSQPQSALSVYMHSQEGKRRPDSQVCGDGEDPETTQLQKWQALNEEEDNDADREVYDNIDV